MSQTRLNHKLLVFLLIIAFMYFMWNLHELVEAIIKTFLQLKGTQP